MTKYWLILSYCVLHLSVFGQQQSQYSMYRFNGLYINPAYAGSHDVMHIMAIYRHQWVKVPGQPLSASLAVHTPMNNEKVALGLIYNYDQLGVTKSHTVNASFAYRLPVGKKKLVKLCFGINAGFTNYSSNLQRVNTTDAGDAGFANNVNVWLPNLGAGIYAYSDKFFAGVSVPQILAGKLGGSYSVFETSTNAARQYHQLMITAGYVFKLGKKVKFIPSGLLKITPANSPVSFDLNANFVFIDRVWLGAGYRYIDSYNFLLAVNITKQLRVGYCYDLTVSPLNKYTTGSHEVMLGFDFRFEQGKVVSPRYLKYF